jgi:multiple sugar transport system ATP-binding protein
MTTVELNEIGKEYENGVKTIQKLNLRIEPGELLVLVGPSGCGKSTVLRMIAGLETITSGTLLFDNQIMNDIPPKSRDIGMVFQNYALYPHLSVAQNLAFPLTLRKMPKAEINQRVAQVADMVGLRDLLERRPKQLSGGQRQRVALGRAIIRTPRVFLFDEPLSNLDAQLRVQMRTEIAALQKKTGATGIYVTHDQAEAMTMGDRIAVLKGGELQQIGSPQHIYNDPDNQFVAGFLGSPAMNFFSGSLSGTDTDTLLFTENGVNPAVFPVHIHDFRNTAFVEHMPVIIGIRPEDCIIHEYEQNQGWQALIQHTEYMGHEKIAYASSAGTLKAIRLPAGSPVQQGRHYSVQFRPEHIFIFSARDGRRL